MAFRIDNENRTFRNLVAICQDHAREVIEIFRKILSMVEDLVEGDRSSIEAELEEVEAHHDGSLEIKRVMVKELNEPGSPLIDRGSLQAH